MDPLKTPITKHISVSGYYGFLAETISGQYTQSVTGRERGLLEQVNRGALSAALPLFGTGLNIGMDMLEVDHYTSMKLMKEARKDALSRGKNKRQAEVEAANAVPGLLDSEAQTMLRAWAGQ